MNQAERKKCILSVILNGTIFVLTVICVIIQCCEYQVGIFIYFTTLSNILCGLAGLAECIDRVALLKDKRSGNEYRKLHRGVMLLKYAGTIGVFVTFLTVVAFLGPLYGYGNMLAGSSFYLHAAGPIMAIISFIFFDGCGLLKKREMIIGMLPVIIYGIVYHINVMELKIWTDFYFFTAYNAWYVTAAAMVVLAFLCSLVIRLLHNKIERKA